MTTMDEIRHTDATRFLCDRGWSVDTALLYDEEGVEGWRWTAPDGREFSEVGAWDGPPPLPVDIEDEPTPGPWLVGPVNPDPDGLPEIIIQTGWLQRHGVAYSVASALPCCAGELSRDEMPRVTRANARLIAAAPDLLIALKAWRAVEEMLDTSPSLLATPEGERLYAEARLRTAAAIARATKPEG